jgi:hypothetical protein
MIKERADELVAALRSGKYPQSRLRLRKTDGFCCLGVACEISKKGEWTKDQDGWFVYMAADHDFSSAQLPRAVRDYFGFNGVNGEFFDFIVLHNDGERAESLASLNDRDWNFDDIATFIEQNWERL